MDKTSASEILDITTDMLVVGQEKLHIGDMEQDFAYFNPFAIGLSMILIGVFIMQYMQGFPEGMSIDLNNFTYKYAAYGNSQNPVGIFTSMFLHGGLDHILGNLVFLYILSLPIYRLTGFCGTSGIFLVAGMAGGSLSYHFGSLPSVGASGGIFGLFGYIAVYYFLKKEELSENLKDLSWVMMIAVIIQIFSGLTVDYIDNFAHFGGCLVGMSLAYWQYGILSKKEILA